MPASSSRAVSILAAAVLASTVRISRSASRKSGRSSRALDTIRRLDGPAWAAPAGHRMVRVGTDFGSRTTASVACRMRVCFSRIGQHRSFPVQTRRHNLALGLACSITGWVWKTRNFRVQFRWPDPGPVSAWIACCGGSSTDSGGRAKSGTTVPRRGISGDSQ